RRHTRSTRDWSSDVCSSDLVLGHGAEAFAAGGDFFFIEMDDGAIAVVEDQLGVGFGAGDADVGFAGFYFGGDGLKAGGDYLVGEIGRASCRGAVNRGGGGVG